MEASCQTVGEAFVCAENAKGELNDASGESLFKRSLDWLCAELLFWDIADRSVQRPGWALLPGSHIMSMRDAAREEAREKILELKRKTAIFPHPVEVTVTYKRLAKALCNARLAQYE